MSPPTAVSALIKSINCSLLCVILIGIPAIAGVRMGSLQVSSIPATQQLIFWGLSLAALGNAAGALGAIKDRRNRKLCWGWAAAFAALLGLELALAAGYLDFDWLKRALLWSRDHV